MGERERLFTLREECCWSALDETIEGRSELNGWAWRTGGLNSLGMGTGPVCGYGRLELGDMCLSRLVGSLEVVAVCPCLYLTSPNRFDSCIPPGMTSECRFALSGAEKIF